MSDPWAWRPDPRGWFGHVAHQALQWRPAAVVDADPRVLSGHVARAAQEQARWLWHPCADALLDAGASRPHRDAQLALWIGMHADEPLGHLDLDAPTELWVGAGSCTLPAGRHELAPQQRAGQSPDELFPDLWCGSTSAPLAGSWADEPPAGEAELHSCRTGLRRLLLAQQLLAEQLPSTYAWLRDVVPVVVPLRPRPGGFRSGSDPARPGLVQLDCRSVSEVLEALVHEAAHEHLFRAETPTPLADPADEQLYPSPLRPEPRPLRGILMAFHALAYICAFYRDAVEVGLLDAEDVEEELVHLRTEAEAAARTLRQNSERLTPGGRDFLDRTSDVLTHSGG